MYIILWLLCFAFRLPPFSCDLDSGLYAISFCRLYCLKIHVTLRVHVLKYLSLKWMVLVYQVWFLNICTWKCTLSWNVNLQKSIWHKVCRRNTLMSIFLLYKQNVEMNILPFLFDRYHIILQFIVINISCAGCVFYFDLVEYFLG